MQTEGWPIISTGVHTRLFAPAGSGKTSAAFHRAVDRVARSTVAPTGYRVIHLSPMKALVDAPPVRRRGLVSMLRAAGFREEPKGSVCEP